VTDDITNWAIHRMFNTNLQYSSASYNIQVSRKKSMACRHVSIRFLLIICIIINSVGGSLFGPPHIYTWRVAEASLIIGCVKWVTVDAGQAVITRQAMKQLSIDGIDVTRSLSRRTTSNVDRKVYTHWCHRADVPLWPSIECMIPIYRNTIFPPSRLIGLCCLIRVERAHDKLFDCVQETLYIYLYSSKNVIATKQIRKGTIASVRSLSSKSFIHQRNWWQNYTCRNAEAGRQFNKNNDATM